ncbi:MAG: hypothetical protein GY928_16715 [Colwellia sp.]|nr:hypothetical protein [Colwellia sp.]
MQNNNDADLVALLQSEGSSLHKDLNNQNSNSINTSAQDIIAQNHMKQNETTVGEKKYEIEKYSISEWLIVSAKLGGTFAAPYALMEQGTEADGGTSIAEAMFALFQNLEGDKPLRVVDDLLLKVTHNGVKVQRDDFADPTELIEVLVDVVKLNYEKVFTKGITLLQNLQK